MTRISSAEAEKAAVKLAAQLMAASARTAPKARGVDSVQSLIVDGEELYELAAAMEAKVDQKVRAIDAFVRDARVVRNAAAVLLLGVTGDPKRPEDPLNCGACGFANCAEFMKESKQEGEDYRGPLCFFQALDLGIALGSAARTAAELNIDNRMMYTIGAAARRLGYLECDAVIGFPLTVTSKNPSFDR